MSWEPEDDEEWMSEDDEAEEDRAEGEDDTVPCPYCGRLIHEEALRCPYCEQYISEEYAPPRRLPVWIAVGVLLCLIMIALWILRG
jgi:hypothetical protein